MAGSYAYFPKALLRMYVPFTAGCYDAAMVIFIQVALSESFV